MSISLLAKGVFSVVAFMMFVHLMGRLFDAGDQMRDAGNAALAQACTSATARATGVCAGDTAQDSK
jgi:hypothetical protein